MFHVQRTGMILESDTWTPVFRHQWHACLELLLTKTTT